MIKFDNIACIHYIIHYIIFIHYYFKSALLKLTIVIFLFNKLYVCTAYIV